MRCAIRLQQTALSEGSLSLSASLRSRAFRDGDVMEETERETDRRPPFAKLYSSIRSPVTQEMRGTERHELRVCRSSKMHSLVTHSTLSLALSLSLFPLLSLSCVCVCAYVFNIQFSRHRHLLIACHHRVFLFSLSACVCVWMCAVLVSLFWSML